MSGRLSFTGSLASIAALAIVTGACGNTPTGPSTPVGPTVPTPVTLVVISLTPGLDTLILGQSARFEVRAVSSDGSSRLVQPAWSLTPPEIATVEAAGTVTPMRVGRAVLAATFEGQTVSTAFRVVPDYSGQWEGGLRVLECSAVVYPSSCMGTELTGFGMTMWVEQVKADVRAYVYLYRSPQVFVSGTIAEDGSIELRGELTNGTYRGFRLDEWRTRIAPGDAMIGNFTSWYVEYSAPPGIPTLRRRYELTSVRRSAPGRQASSVMSTLGLIRSGGHLSCGGHDVQTDARTGLARIRQSIALHELRQSSPLCAAGFKQVGECVVEPLRRREISA